MASKYQAIVDVKNANPNITWTEAANEAGFEGLWTSNGRGGVKRRSGNRLQQSSKRSLNTQYSTDDAARAGKQYENNLKILKDEASFFDPNNPVIDEHETAIDVFDKESGASNDPDNRHPSTKKQGELKTRVEAFIKRTKQNLIVRTHSDSGNPVVVNRSTHNEFEAPDDQGIEIKSAQDYDNLKADYEYSDKEIVFDEKNNGDNGKNGKNGPKKNGGTQPPPTKNGGKGNGPQPPPTQNGGKGNGAFEKGRTIARNVAMANRANLPMFASIPLSLANNYEKFRQWSKNPTRENAILLGLATVESLGDVGGTVFPVLEVASQVASRSQSAIEMQGALASLRTIGAKAALMNSNRQSIVGGMKQIPIPTF
jgi:hypothetical protein